MNEAIFEVRIDLDNYYRVEPKNNEAKELEKRWNNTFPKKSIFIYILNCPNTLEKTEKNILTYSLDMSYENEIFNELKK